MTRVEADRGNRDEASFVERHKGAIVGGSMVLGFAPLHEAIHAITAKLFGARVNDIIFFPSGYGKTIAITDIDSSSLTRFGMFVAYISPSVVLGIISIIVLKRAMKEIEEGRWKSVDGKIGIMSKYLAGGVCMPYVNCVMELSSVDKGGDLRGASKLILDFIYQRFPEFHVLGSSGSPSTHSGEIVMIALTTALTALTIVAAKPIERLAALIKKTVKGLRHREVENGVDS